MKIKVLHKTCHTRLQQLEQEVRLLRSALIGIIGKDPEGVYRPECVERLLLETLDKPTKKFIDSKSFLKDIS